MAELIKTNNKEDVSLIINALIEMIKNPNLPIINNAYFYHPKARNNFIIYLYIFKLKINSKDYLQRKYNEYLQKYDKNNFLNCILNFLKIFSIYRKLLMLIIS